MSLFFIFFVQRKIYTQKKTKGLSHDIGLIPTNTDIKAPCIELEIIIEFTLDV